MFIVHPVAVAAALTDDKPSIRRGIRGKDRFRILEACFDPSGRLEYFLGRRRANIPAKDTRSLHRPTNETKNENTHFIDALSGMTRGPNSATIRPNGATINTDCWAPNPVLQTRRARDAWA